MSPWSVIPTDPMETLPVCYRHPNRATGLACSNCGKPLCSDCSIDSPVGQKCVECAAQSGRGKVVTSAQIRRQGTQLPPVTMGILAVGIGLFVLTFLGGDLRFDLFRNFQLRAADVADGEWYRLFTHAFLHDGLLHIGFNMYALYLLGPAIERRVGSLAFAGLYAASGLAGAAAYVAIGSGAPAVGASGAIFGLFGAWLASAWSQRHTTYGQANLRGIGVILGINLLLPLIIPNIAWEAHVGGLVAGFIISYAWTKLPQAENVRAAFAIGLAVAAFALGLMV